MFSLLDSGADELLHASIRGLWGRSRGDEAETSQTRRDTLSNLITTLLLGFLVLIARAILGVEQVKSTYTNMPI